MRRHRSACRTNGGSRKIGVGASQRVEEERDRDGDLLVTGKATIDNQMQVSASGASALLIGRSNGNPSIEADLSSGDWLIADRLKSWLEANGVGETPQERAELAAKILDILSTGLYESMVAAKDILFVAAAGNDAGSGMGAALI